MRIFLLLFLSWFFTQTRAQSPAGYWLSEDKTGFFDGLESMEMRLDPGPGQYNGNIYYIWEHGMYYQEVSLEGKFLPGDSVVLKEVALVSNRNGVFPNDCQGFFHLRYSKDSKREYLTGVWKKPPGSNFRYPDTKVTFYRAIPPDAAWAHPSGAPAKSGTRHITKSQTQVAAAAAPVAVIAATPSAPPPVIDQDSLRIVAFKSRKDTVEMIVPHHGDTARLELYDNAIVDGDRVSLFLGDSLILKNYELLEKPKLVSLVLDTLRKDQTLSMYAENLGEIPPNTALMVIYIDDQRYDVRLSSDLKTNALVVFRKLK